jgi:FG-GAP-like repeat
MTNLTFRRVIVSALAITLFGIFGPGAVRGQVVAPEPLLIPSSLPSLEYGSLDLGDYDLDGDLDLLMTGRIGDNFFTRLYRAEDSTFVITVGLTVLNLRYKVYRVAPRIIDNVWQGTSDWGDYDGDGDLDFVLTGITEIDRTVDERVTAPVTKVFLNFKGSFRQDFDIVLPDVYNGPARWVDFDGDGRLDLYVSGASRLESPFRPESALLRNTSAGFVEVVDSGIPSVMFGDADWTDVDLDGDMDVFISGETEDGTLSALFRNVDGTRFERDSFSFPDLAFGSVDWGDYDGDGYEDLLLTGGRLDPRLLRGETLIYRNEAGITFSRLNQTFPGVAQGGGRWLDYDVDGSLDFVVTGMTTPFTENAGWIYVNEGGKFNREMKIGGLAFSALSVGDYNGDGDPDILNMGINSQGKVFLNFFMNRVFPEILPPGLFPTK